MIIPCVSCHRIFRVDDSIIKPTGSMVRCSKCHHIFIVYQTGDHSEPELSDRRISNAQKNASNESSAIHNIPSNFASSILDELFDLDQ